MSSLMSETLARQVHEQRMREEGVLRERRATRAEQAEVADKPMPRWLSLVLAGLATAGSEGR